MIDDVARHSEYDRGRCDVHVETVDARIAMIVKGAVTR